MSKFLFRECHLRKAKSATAASAVIAMNPDMKGHIRARLDRVHEATEDIFNDDFFANTDIVSNALDNVKARLYLDSRCVQRLEPSFRDWLTLQSQATSGAWNAGTKGARSSGVPQDDRIICLAK